MIEYDCSGALFDVGNKSVQGSGEFTPAANVFPVAGNRHVRMEDCATATVVRGCMIAAVTDGHGSVPVMAEGGVETRHLGGFEVARLVLEVCVDHVATCAEKDPAFERSTKEHVARVLQDAFDAAQRTCERETDKGARNSGGGKDPSDRVLRLIGNRVDGAHFADFYRIPPRIRHPALDPRVLLYDKHREPYLGGHVIRYVGTDIDAPADFGTTCTVAVLLPSPEGDPSPARLIVANAGDSDVYLFSRGEDTGYRATRVSTEHSIHNPVEARRVLEAAKGSVSVRDPYFCIDTGPFSGNKIMPSRSLGHTVWRHHGITHRPDVTMTAIYHDDVVIVASDGLWSGFGVAERGIPTGIESPEDMSAARVARLIDRHSAKSAADIGRIIRRAVADNVQVRDNLALVVVKCSDIPLHQ